MLEILNDEAEVIKLDKPFVKKEKRKILRKFMFVQLLAKGKYTFMKMSQNLLLLLSLINTLQIKNYFRLMGLIII